MSFGNDLAAGRILLIDGGTGSELRRRSVALDPICWSAAANLEHPDTLVDIHREYIEAGADVVTANTFGTARFVLAAAGLDDRFVEINTQAVRAARRARDSEGRSVTVAASMSCMPPGFDTSAYPDSRAELAAYRELAELFAALSVDVIVLEMMQETVHAPLACRAARESGLPFWLGLSCRIAGAPDPQYVGRSRASLAAERSSRIELTAFDDPTTPFGATVDALVESGPEAVCIMHSPVDAVAPALDRLRRSWSGIAGAYAEVGYPEDPERRGATRMDPETYAAAAESWLDMGAQIVGGCCGTTPGHVRALRELIRARESD